MCGANWQVDTIYRYWQQIKCVQIRQNIQRGCQPTTDVQSSCSASRQGLHQRI